MIIDAARRLFLRSGYSKTSVSRIAREAGVAPETVYANFGAKRAILAVVLDLASVGHDTPSAPVDWPEVIRSESDLARKVELLAVVCRAIYERSSAILDVVRAAADSEPELVELLRQNQQHRLAAQANIIGQLADARALRPGVSVEEAPDLYRIVASPEVYGLLVRDRGWDPAQYEHWVFRTLCGLLLDPEPGGGQTQAGVKNTGNGVSGQTEQTSALGTDDQPGRGVGATTET
jgi:AcrR family transcriptional regulator